MASFSLLSPVMHMHDLDLTTYLHKITLHPTVDELDATTFGSTFVTRLPGLKTIEAHGEGFWDSTPDASIFPSLGVVDRVFTASPEGAATKTAYMFQLASFDYQEFGQVGQVTPFSFIGKNTNSQGLIRGQLAAAKGNVSATGQLGSILTIAGPASAAQFVYATFHVFSIGTTITIQVQSAPTVGFAAPVTRGTIGPLTTTGGSWLVRVAGPITDGFWRFNVSAITGTFSVAGAIAVQ